VTLAEPTFLTLVGALGASLGSFVNVVAWRLPLGRSLTRPASSCPACGHPVRWRDNVPVLGWFLLGGRCRDCRVAISFRYPLVELTGALLAIAIWLLHSGPGVMPASLDRLLPTVIVPFVLHLAFAMALVALVLIDLDWFLLPDRITLPLALLGFLTALAASRQTGVTLQDAALGALVGGGAPLVLGLTYQLATGRVGLGGGDWKLLLGVGAWLGLSALPFVLFAGAVQGLVAAAIFRRDFALAAPPPLPGEEPPPAPVQALSEEVPFRRLHVPFGPFLALAALEWLLFSRELGALFARAIGGAR